MSSRKNTLKYAVLFVISVMLIVTCYALKTSNACYAEELSGTTTSSDATIPLSLGGTAIENSGEYNCDSPGMKQVLGSGTVRVEYLDEDGNAIPNSDGAKAVKITLNDTYFYPHNVDFCRIQSHLPLIINLVGSNHMKYYTSHGQRGIYCNKEIEFMGSGDLKIEAIVDDGEGASKTSAGIQATDGSITFSGTGYIETSGYVTGISANGTLNFKLGQGGKVDASCYSKGYSAFYTMSWENHKINFGNNNEILKPSGGKIIKVQESEESNYSGPMYTIADNGGSIVQEATIINNNGNPASTNAMADDEDKTDDALADSAKEDDESTADLDEAEENGIGETIVLKPGDTCTVTDQMKANTEIVIKAAGNYTITGSSSKAHLVIGTGGSGTASVTLNGFTQNLEKSSSNAGITITDDGGTVELISAANTSNVISATKLHAAIEKNGSNTKLVFKTANTASPGTITARSASGSGAPAIGGISCTCGNIYFESGNISAWGGGGPGIGASQSANKLDNIVFNGATVTAEGTSFAPGIGTNECIEIGTITINSGKITATANKGAGIGGGGAYLGKEGKQANIEAIIINGGTINATSQGGCAAIGSGAYNYTKRITINGGTIDATTDGVLGKSEGFSVTSGAAAIGGAGVLSYGRCTNITITGGDITTTANGTHGCGIGPGYSALGWNTVNISGGSLALGAVANDGYPIGGTQYSDKKATYLKVNISGGTINALTNDAKQKAIGTFDSLNRPLAIKITGGSFNGANLPLTPENDDGEKLELVKIKLVGINDDYEITLPGLKKHVNNKYQNYNYGSKDIHTISPDSATHNLYLWLPTNYVYLNKINAKNGGNLRILYGYTYSSWFGFSDATFKPGSDVTLRASGVTSGFATIGYYQKSAENITAPDISTDTSIEAYYIDEELKTKVMNEDGSLVAKVSGYTDWFGRWINENENVTLYAKTKATTYTIKYDANVPDGASKSVTGSMGDKTCTRGEVCKLDNVMDNGAFSLPGYRFDRWTTKADGSGTAYDNCADVGALLVGDGAVVTLYAQWKPLNYYVAFDKNGGTGDTPDKKLFFDITDTLSANGYTKDNAIFGGWLKATGVGAKAYADQEKVENLISGEYLSGLWKTAYETARTNKGAEPTIEEVSAVYENHYGPSGDRTIVVAMIAQWKSPGDFSARITLDNQTPSGTQNISLRVSESSETDAYSGDTDAEGNISFANVEAGTYYIYVNGKSTDISWTTDGSTTTEMIFLQYFSYAVKKDDHVGTVSVKAADGSAESPFSEKPNATLVGNSIIVSASDFANGYVFESWNSVGTDPDNFGSKANENPASMQIAGETVLKAESKKIGQYKVVYKANGGTGDDVEVIEDVGVGGAILPCSFTRDGYSFKEWNTDPDGSGARYKAGQEYMDLADSGETVNLYAIWKRPSIIEGAGQSITVGEKVALRFRSDAQHSDFIEVRLNGETLSDEYYTLSSGSTVVTLNADYVASLPIGKYILSIVSDDGTADAEFSIVAAPEKKKTDTKKSGSSTKTGDSNQLLLYTMLGLSAALACVLMLKKKH